MFQIKRVESDEIPRDAMSIPLRSLTSTIKQIGTAYRQYRIGSVDVAPPAPPMKAPRRLHAA